MPEKAVVVYFILKLLLLSSPFNLKNLETRMTLMGASFIGVEVIGQELILI